MTTHKVITGSSISMTAIEDQSVDLIVTSPPYPMIGMWDSMFSEQDPAVADSLSRSDGEEAFRRMHSLLDMVWTECDRVLKPDRFVCINIGDAVRTVDGKFQMYPNHARIIEAFVKMGYSVLPDIHWRKQTNAPNKFMGSGMYPAGAYVTYEHEYILIFRKGCKRVFTGEERKIRQKSAYFWEERNVWFSDLWDIKGTGQILTDEAGRDRNASFPLEIPHRLVNMYSIKGDTVLDPFLGLGTTGIACLLSGRNSIGIEIALGAARLALKSIALPADDANRYIDRRIQNHIAFISSLPENKRGRCYTNRPHGFAVRTRQETEAEISRIRSVEQAGNICVCRYETDQKPSG